MSYDLKNTSPKTLGTIAAVAAAGLAIAVGRKFFGKKSLESLAGTGAQPSNQHLANGTRETFARESLKNSEH
jgi:hypothetical protein